VTAERGQPKMLRDQLFDTAVRSLARAPRTERQIRARLERLGWATPELVDDVVHSLRRYGYLDDAEFARRYCEQRAEAGKGAPGRLRAELRRKGIDDGETIERAIAATLERRPERESIEALLEKRLRGRTHLDDRELRRLRDALLRDGFDRELVAERLRSLRSSGEVSSRAAEPEE
jgi:regulatory protein